MLIKPIKTRLVTANKISLLSLIDESIKSLQEGDMVAISSKVVSLCEGRVVPIDKIDKEELIKQESQYYMPAFISKYGYHFTINNNTLISMAGIDESNGDNNYVLWPEDPQATANNAWRYLRRRFGIKEVGVVITDSTIMPMRWGTMGIALAYCGFRALNNYVGQPDLFGRPFKASQAAIANGLAATAVLAMGEGTEQTPLAIIKDAPFVQFLPRKPSKTELELFYIAQKEDDVFAPFINALAWKKGKRSGRAA